MFRIIVHILLFLALAVLIGGIAFFGAGVASVVFQPGLLPSRTLAGAVNAAVLHRLNIMQGVCAVILPIALGYLAFTEPKGASRIGFGLSIPLVIVVLYLGLKLFPEVNALRLEISDFDHVLAIKEPLLDRFQSLHKLYSRLAQGVLLVSLGLFVTQIILLARAAGRKGSGEGESKRQGEGAKVKAEESGNRQESEKGRSDEGEKGEGKAEGKKGAEKKIKTGDELPKGNR